MHELLGHNISWTMKVHVLSDVICQSLCLCVLLCERVHGFY